MRLTPWVILATAVALGGCVATTGDGPATAAATPAVGPGQRAIERDVEAPEVFQVTEAGLWDGRPSLGGVWVAHPTARDPERVLIRNTRTGATVIGALFRRERDNPGPRFQVSSEAANALGILAGAPTEIAVTALRLQRVEMEIDPAPAPDATAASETLALAPVPAPVPAATQPPAPTAALSDSVPSTAPEGQVAITEDPPRRRTLREILRGTPAPEPEIAATPLAPVAGAAAAAAATIADDPAPPSAGEGGGLRRLFRRTPVEPDTTPIALPEESAAVATEPAPPAQPVRLDRPFVQIGIFSVEQNAQNARAQMQSAGLNAEIRRGRVGENLFWRVVVGPAASTADRAAILQRVRGLGFADAYAVVR